MAMAMLCYARLPVLHIGGESSNCRTLEYSLFCIGDCTYDLSVVPCMHFVGIFILPC